MDPASSFPPIKGFLETSLIDWPGCVCAVVFLPYCNLRCPYCHNHQLVLKPDTLDTLPLDSVLERLTSLDEWVDGICVTGGEPTIHRGLPAMLEAIQAAGIRTGPNRKSFNIWFPTSALTTWPWT
jgi:pyruvate formate lyase activating enzyme